MINFSPTTSIELLQKSKGLGGLFFYEDGLGKYIVGADSVPKIGGS